MQAPDYIILLKYVFISAIGSKFLNTLITQNDGILDFFSCIY